jgi:hypothetical protein
MIPSMSYANVKSPTSTSSPEITPASIKDIFESSSKDMEEYVRENLPDLQALKPKAVSFLSSILGKPGETEADRIVHDEIDLCQFVEIFTSKKLAALSQIQIGKETYQLRLRYFGGMGERTDPSDAAVINNIAQFFKVIFNDPEWKSVNDCVRRARSLFVTARNKNPMKAPPPSSLEEVGSSTILPSEPVYEETIISCINFALLNDKGFYVNWLGTSNENITKQKYGDELLLLTKGGSSWQRHHLATFLLKAVNLAVIGRLRNFKKLSSSYNIVLQARATAEENAAKFYLAIGFDEGGYVESVPDLAAEVFEDFDSLLTKAETSNTDYIHFIWGSPDIVMFKNSTGKLSKSRTLSRSYMTLFPELTEVSDQNDPYHFIAPFSATRLHLMILSTDLEFFYLPFCHGLDMTDFILPSSTGLGRHYTNLTTRDRSKFVDKGGWLTDQCVDLLLGW